MKVLLLLALAAVGHCALLGSKKCTYGPAYWCSHIDHAKECGAVQHCISTAWKNQRSGMTGSTETCFDVIKVLDIVRDSAEDNLMEQWVIGCTGMPAEKRQLCKDLTKDMNEIAMLLKSDLSSLQIATALKLCGGSADAVSHPLQVSGDQCKDCVNFMGDLREILKNSEGEAETVLKNMVCSKAGALESLCDQLVDQYGQMIFNMVYQRLNPQDICQAIHLCANQTHADLMKSLKYMLAKRKLGSAECDVCKSLMQDVLSALKNPTLQTDVLSALENEVCPLLGSFADQCKTLVATYGPVAFQLLTAELNPQTVCQGLGLCNATKSDNGKLTHVSLGSPMGTVKILPPKKEKTSVECFLCKYLVGELEKIAEGKTAQELEAELEDLCKDLPDEISGECTQLVETYGTEIIQFLLSEVTPDKICALVGVCPSARQTVKLEVPVKSSEKCEVCKWVLNFVKQELNSSKAKTMEKQFMEKICDFAGGYKQLCDMFLDEYYPAVVNLIEEEIDPVKLCSVVDLCGKAVAQHQDQPLQFQPMMELQPAAKHYLLGGNKCLFGPSVWCASQDNAQLCNAVEYCKKAGYKLDG